MARRVRWWATVFGDRPLERISDTDIRRLVSEKVAEARYLDFKLTFDHGSDEAREGLLRHVTSFANSSGGCLMFGIRDDGHGRAQRFEGVQTSRRGHDQVHPCPLP
jgi:predicted HTH transcriptional regulator